MKKLLAMILCLLIPVSSIASPRVASLKENDKAPFAGYLFDYEAFATMKVEKDSVVQKCSLEKEHIQNKCSIDQKYQQESCKIQLDALSKNLDDSLKVKPVDNWQLYLAGTVGLIVGAGVSIIAIKVSSK